MHIAMIFRILGLLLMLFSISLLPPIVVSLIYEDEATRAFIDSLFFNFILGFACWLPVRRERQELRTRDGFVITVLFWGVLTLVGAMPLMISEHPGLSFADAFFESASGWTTTGSTVISGLDNLPPSILFYRQQLQWFGGMGLVVLAVAILPMLGIGGMQLYRAETPGPMKDSKLTPRIAETAKSLWYIYLAMTIACTFAYWICGMNFFDAIGHAFATVSTGGLSTHDASFAYFNSPLIETVAIVFMIMGSINFALHFFALRHASLRHYLQDPEFKLMLWLILLATLLCTLILARGSVYEPLTALRYSLFQVVSIMTTTGFGVADFSIWPLFLPVLVLFLGFSSGCAGSTVGGIKLIRVILVFKQGSREIKRLIHPNGVFPIKVGGKAVDSRVSQAVWGFVSVYVLVYIALMMVLMASGLDMVTAFSAVAATLNNVGPGLGAVAANFGDLNDVAKWTLSFAMLLGRLEIFTILVLLSPTFWRQ